MFFFFNDTATTEIYTLSLHDALPICAGHEGQHVEDALEPGAPPGQAAQEHGGEHHRKRVAHRLPERSEEHTSELQSRQYLVCRLLLEKKKKTLNLAILLSTSPHSLFT